MAKKRLNKLQQENYTAYHEAGHAVVAYWLFGLRRIRKITIIPEPKWNSLGSLKPNRIMKDIDYETENSPAFEGKAMCEIQELFAGPIAEKKIRKRMNSIGARKDFEDVIDLASRLYGGLDRKLLKSLQDYLYRKTELLVEQHWKEIEAVAKELVREKELNREDFYRIQEKRN